MICNSFFNNPECVNDLRQPFQKISVNSLSTCGSKVLLSRWKDVGGLIQTAGGLELGQIHLSQIVGGSFEMQLAEPAGVDPKWFELFQNAHPQESEVRWRCGDVRSCTNGRIRSPKHGRPVDSQNVQDNPVDISRS